MVVYDFETDDEGFTNGGVGSITTTLRYEFDSVYTGVFSIATGQSDSYFFELVNLIDYDVVQSINAYSTAKISEIFKSDVYHEKGYVERRLLNSTITMTDNTYSTKRFYGEPRK